MAELVRLPVDVLVVESGLAGLAAKKATQTIPIVMAPVGDPVGSGFVASLGRPGGNITGVSLFAPALGGKRLELLKEAVPKVSRVGVLYNPTNPDSAPQLRETEVAARALGVTLLQPLGVRGLDEFASAFSALANERAEALNVLADGLFLAQRNGSRSWRSRVDCRRCLRDTGFAEAGGLMNYGPSITDSVRRAATYVDKILKGAKPGDLPIEQPTTFELVINMKTAKALGLTIPPSVLARADELIQ